MALSAFAWGAVALFVAAACALVLVLWKLRAVAPQPAALAEGAPAAPEPAGAAPATDEEAP